MRVSKIVREYIEKEIAKKFPIKDTEAYTAAQKSMNAFSNELHDKVVAMVEAEVAAYRAAHPEAVEAELKSYAHNYSVVCWSMYNTPLGTENRKQRNVAEESRAAALENIIVTLELGGTKADLERMLAELG